MCHRMAEVSTHKVVNVYILTAVAVLDKTAPVPSLRVLHDSHRHLELSGSLITAIS